MCSAALPPHDEAQVHHLRGRCLVHHSPSPQQCALRGDVWDDSALDEGASFGGVCRTAEAMSKRIGVSPHSYEVRLTLDGRRASHLRRRRRQPRACPCHHQAATARALVPPQTVQVNVSFDPASFGFAGRARLELTCVRRAPGDAARNANAAVFGLICASRVDFDDFPLDVEDKRGWDVFLPQDLREAWLSRLRHHRQQAA